METFFIVFGALFLLKYSYDRFIKKRKTSEKKSNKRLPAIQNSNSPPQDERELAIENLMKNLEQAKTNRPEIIEDDPKLAAKILKSWADK